MCWLAGLALPRRRHVQRLQTRVDPADIARKAIAMADDVPELVSELKKRSIRIAHLESQILAAKRTPDDLVLLIETIEASARAKLHDLRSALADQRDLREVFLTLFPDGLTFTPAPRTATVR